MPVREELLKELEARVTQWETEGQVDQEWFLKQLRHLEPFDVAELLEELPPSGQRLLFDLLPVEFAADVLDRLDPDTAYDLLKNAPADRMAELFKRLPEDIATDIAGAIHPRKAEVLLGLMPPEIALEVRKLLQYAPDTAGGRMTIDHISVRASWPVERVLAHIRKVGGQVESIPYVYVVDEKNRLLGVTTLRDLILADPRQPVQDIMEQVNIRVLAESDQEEAARLLTHYNLKAVPVVDQFDRLLGMITVDDIIDVIEEETTEDISRLGGTEPLEVSYANAGFLPLFRKRVGWLLLLFVAESLTGTILRRYAGFLEQVVALSFFIPLLIGTGGNAGGQAATIIIRAMVVGEVTAKDFLRVVFREMRLGLALGIAMALGAAMQAFLLGGSAKIGLTVACTITAIVTLSSSLGATLPLIGRKLGLDPAVFSAPMITTIVDSTGLIIYFTIANLILGIA